MSAGVEVLSCERRTSAMLKSLSHLLPSGIHFLFVVSESVTQRNPSPVLGNSMLQFSTRGTFEDCYTNIPFLRRGFPPPLYFAFLPFQAVS